MARTVQAKLEECRAALKEMGRDRNYWRSRAERGEERIGELRVELTEEREASRQLLTRLNRADARIGRLRGLNSELRATLTKERAEASASKWSQARDQADPPVNLVAPTPDHFTAPSAPLGYILRYPSTRPNDLRPRYTFYRPDSKATLKTLRDYTRRSRGELYEVRTNMVRLELDAREADPPVTPPKTIPRPDPCTAEYTPAGEDHTYRCLRVAHGVNPYDRDTWHIDWDHDHSPVTRLRLWTSTGANVASANPRILYRFGMERGRLATRAEWEGR